MAIDLMHDVSRTDRILVLVCCGLGVAGLTAGERYLGPDAPLGGLFFVPLLVAAAFIPRWTIFLLAIATALLRESFGPFSWHQDAPSRVALSLVAYAGGGLFAGELVRNRRMAIELLRAKQEESRFRIESLRVLTAGIAHDFNNLLMGILGNASIAAEIIPSSSPAQQFLTDMITAGQRLSDLTLHLLAYSGRGALNTTALNLGELVRETSTLIEASVPKHVHVRLQLDDQLLLTNADPSQVQQIIMNLIINGAEAIPAGAFGSVLVSTGSQVVDDTYIKTILEPPDLPLGPYVYLEVQDTGTGMDAETQEHIFEPFFTTKVKGRGLGLAAVLGIVHSHKGAIKVDSQRGKGSTFKILLPAVQGGMHRVPSSKRSELHGTGTILVVDDEEVVRKVAKAALELNGYTVILANDGQDALHIFDQRANEIDVVLLDQIMPNMDGEETCRRLRLRRPEVRVILTSGHSDTQAQALFADKALPTFIKKPYTAAALCEIVQRVINMQHGSAPSE
jgi:signal transduction histidine kinase/CheY-like chemotaxis protein